MVSKMVCIINEWTTGNFQCRLQAIEVLIAPIRAAISAIQIRIGNNENDISALQSFPTIVEKSVNIGVGVDLMVSTNITGLIKMVAIDPICILPTANPLPLQDVILKQYFLQYDSGTNVTTASFFLDGTVATAGLLQVRFRYILL